MRQKPFWFKPLFLEPKQFKNNLIMFKDKPQFEFCRLLAGSNFEVDAQKNQNDV